MFGEIIKQLRRDRKMSQEEFGKIFNISGPAVSKWETGQTEPDHQLLKEVANYFGVSTDYLLGNTSNSTTEEEIRILKNLLVRNDYMKPDDDLTETELENMMKMAKNNKDFLKGEK